MTPGQLFSGHMPPVKASLSNLSCSMFGQNKKSEHLQLRLSRLSKAIALISER